MDNIKTYIVNGLHTSVSLGPTGITGYKGCFYYLSSSGGKNNNNNTSAPKGGFQGYYGASSGYVLSGYIDFDYPYTVSNVDLNTIVEGPTNLSVSFTNDPTLGASPMVITVPQGDVGTLPDTTGDVSSLPTDYITTGYSPGTIIIKPSGTSVIDQRANLYVNSPTQYTQYNQTSSLTSQYGTTLGSTGDSFLLCGGGGFYGNNGGNTGAAGYGYSSGMLNTGATGYGYGVISLIPSTMIESSHFITGNTGITGASDFVLYSLLGGGGAGGTVDSNGDYGGGAGGGGAGDWISGLIQTSSLINLSIGLGGTGIPYSGGAFYTGPDGGDTVLTYNTVRSITVAGGKGGGATGNSNVPSGYIPQGNGGMGYYGGGGGVNGSGSFTNVPYAYGSMSCSLVNIYYGDAGYAKSGENSSGNGAGYVNTNYGQGVPDCGEGDNNAASGGGGGFWGGIGIYNGDATVSKNASGYGCGGGGGSVWKGNVGAGGGSGSNGYAIINYIKKSPNIKIFRILNYTYFNATFLSSIKGFWFFLAGDSVPNQPYNSSISMPLIGKSYHNTGHFLVKEDGVNYIKFYFNNNYMNIDVGFSYLNNIQQTYNLPSNSQQTYAMILFYT